MNSTALNIRSFSPINFPSSSHLSNRTGSSGTKISRILLDCMKRLFSGNKKHKMTKKGTCKVPYHFFIIFLSILPCTIGQNPILFDGTTGFCQIVWGFCQKISLTPNGLYFFAKESQNRSSPTPECKNPPKNTRK